MKSDVMFFERNGRLYVWVGWLTPDGEKIPVCIDVFRYFADGEHLRMHKDSLRDSDL